MDTSSTKYGVKSFLEPAIIKSGQKYSNHLKILCSLSPSLNLLMIRRAPKPVSGGKNLREILGDVRKHLKLSDVLNIYINLDSMAMGSAGYFSQLTKLINCASAQNKQINVYWKTVSNQALQKSALSFFSQLDCNFVICDI